MRHYKWIDDDVICIGWAIAGLIAVLLVLLGFIVMELI